MLDRGAVEMSGSLVERIFSLGALSFAIYRYLLFFFARLLDNIRIKQSHITIVFI